MSRASLLVRAGQQMSTAMNAAEVEEHASRKLAGKLRTTQRLRIAAATPPTSTDLALNDGNALALGSDAYFYGHADGEVAASTADVSATDGSCYIPAVPSLTTYQTDVYGLVVTASMQEDAYAIKVRTDEGNEFVIGDTRPGTLKFLNSGQTKATYARSLPFVSDVFVRSTLTLDNYGKFATSDVDTGTRDMSTADTANPNFRDPVVKGALLGLNLSHANTWSGDQTFDAMLVIGTGGTLQVNASANVSQFNSETHFGAETHFQGGHTHYVDTGATFAIDGTFQVDGTAQPSQLNSDVHIGNSKTLFLDAGSTLDMVSSSNQILSRGGTIAGGPQLSGAIGIKGTTTVDDAVNFVFGTSTGTKIGSGSSQKLGFFGNTPVAQQSSHGSQTANSTYSTTEMNMLQDCYSALRALGFIA